MTFVTFTLLGLDFMSALSAATSSLGNIGQANGSVSPINNFSHLSVSLRILLNYLVHLCFSKTSENEKKLPITNSLSLLI